MKSREIQIIGGGISGATTGVVLQLLGLDTEIVTRQRADRVQHKEDPAFASLYPSASVIPHSTYGEDLKTLFMHSSKLFGLIHNHRPETVRVNRHFEVFEFPADLPPYIDWMDRPRAIDGPPGLPRRKDASDLWGWSFDCYFADWPRYLPRIFRWYEQLGGSIRIHGVEPKELPELDADILINCTGMGSVYLFKQEQSTRVLKGHLVKIGGAPPIESADGKFISYNYTPTADVYSGAEGTPCDVYCYPRGDGWIIGGSRQEGTLDRHGNWQGEENRDPVATVDGVELPAEILSVNRSILRNSYGYDLDDYPDRRAFVGYRYIRDQGLRLERDSSSGKTVIHNYGHGGAGVTLSWGSAVKVASLLPRRHSPADDDTVDRSALFRDMRKAIREIAGL